MVSIGLGLVCLSYTGPCLTLSACTGVRMCLCDDISTRGQGLSIINMSWWISLRCGDMCVYSAVSRANRDRRERQTNVCSLIPLSLSVDNGTEVATSFPGHIVSAFMCFFPNSSCLCNAIKGLVSKCYWRIVVFTTSGLTGKDRKSLWA